MSPEMTAVLIMFLVRFALPVALLFGLGTLLAARNAKAAR